MATKKKEPKKEDRPKQKEKPNKDKTRQRVPTRIYKSVNPKKNSIQLDEEMNRNSARVQGVVRASSILKDMGYMSERGNSLVIVPRLKLMLAFDSMDLDESLKKNADISNYVLIHVSARVFKSKQDLTTFLKDAVDVFKSQEVKPKNMKRSKNFTKSLDKNIS